MSTSSAVAELQQAATASRGRLAALRTMVEDRPDGHDNVVADLVGDACDDLDGWLASLEAASDAARAAVRARRPEAVAGAVEECTTASEHALQSFVAGLGGVDSLSRLRRLAADSPGAWTTWAWAVQDAVAALWTDLSTLRRHLDRCWQELVDHLLRDPVIVHALEPSGPGPAVDASPGG